MKMAHGLETLARGAVALTSVVLLVACATGKDKDAKVAPEAFGSTTTHSRAFATAPAFTCEAARRALLSQGFLIFGADAEHVNGRKNFQPQPDNHVEIEFHATCVPDGRDGRKTIAFVNALQDRYALKKSNNSASVGVGMIGSLSLPFSSSDDAMVKVASETITSAPFYDKFFSLLERYMAADSASLPKDAADPIVPVPTAAASAPAAPASAP
ncbi:MAG: DUF2242 domain-containing protein [Pseudomonadota bacterium]|nr:DUF2242 domain-containing protein [Pseudomonadota bacterium]